DPEHPYLTVPIDGILPKEVSGFVGDQESGEAHVAVLSLKDGRRVAIVCLPHSLVLLSPITFRAMGIENDRMSGGERIIHLVSGDQVRIAALEPGTLTMVDDKWINISDRLGLITSGQGFIYTPAGGYTQKGVAADRVGPRDARVWQIVPDV